jgi:catechol 2,3-dioxygenase-like lactoylglutathione lyase family enzyme
MFRHVGIVVNDLDKMIWFYQDLIGLEIIYDKIEEGRFLNHILNSNNKSPRIIKLGRNNKTIVELLYFGDCKINKKNLFDNGYTHFALTIDDSNCLYDKFIKNGLSVINTPTISDEKTVKVFFGVDPENNIIEFVELL